MARRVPLMSSDGEILYRERQDAGLVIGGPDGGGGSWTSSSPAASEEWLTGHDGNRIRMQFLGRWSRRRNRCAELAEGSRRENDRRQIGSRRAERDPTESMERLHPGARGATLASSHLEPSGTARYVAILGGPPVPSRTLTLDKRARELLEQVESAAKAPNGSFANSSRNTTHMDAAQ